MSDFLHNLRTGKFKRHDRNNRAYNEAQNKSAQWRSDNDKRKGTQQIPGVSERVTSLITETIVEIKTILEDIADAQRRLANAYETNLAVQERTADAMESIADLLRGSFENDHEQTMVERPGLRLVKQVNESEDAGDPDVIADLDVDQEGLLKNILEMRREGMSYEQIAQQLDAEGLPTMSGKGKWRAQAVSRLCKQTTFD